MSMIANWWHTVFFDMMGGNVLLMFLFGWEIFTIPFGLALLLLAAIFSFGAAAIGGIKDSASRKRR